MNQEISFKEETYYYYPETLISSVGIEYSFVNSVNSNSIKKTHKLYETAKESIPFKENWLEFDSIHYDCGAVEIPSPIHNTHEEILSYYRRLIKFTKKFNLVPKSPGYISGGLHFHFDITNTIQSENNSSAILPALKNIKLAYIDMANRPYLNWIFNEAHDYYNANSFFSDEASYRFINLVESKPYFDVNDLFNYELKPKTKPIRFDTQYNTLEFRFFDMIENEDELILYLLFIFRYYEYLTRDSFVNLAFPSKNHLRRDIHPKNFYYKSNIHKYMEEFGLLLQILKLDFKDFEKFTKKFYKRFKWGKRYLV